MTIGISAALFDMDGTIYDTERLYAEGWRRGAAAFGHVLTDEMICQFHGRTPEDNGRLYRKWFGEDTSYLEARRIRTDYCNAYIEAHGVPVKPGLHALLDELKARDIPVVIATGSERVRAEAYAARTGILDYIRFFVCREDVKKGKPNPEIFLKAASLLALPPSGCLVFEDSANGVHAAKAAGCRVFINPDMDPVTEELRATADYVLRDLNEAAELLRSGAISHNYRPF